MSALASALASRLARFRPGGFTAGLLATVALASLLPCSGNAAVAVHAGTKVAIALLFFLHGARLPREAIVAGLAHWRLHLTVLAATFVLFPLLALAAAPLSPWLIAPPLYLGFLFLAALPSTVQSSIAFTSMAGGNVPAAVCAASASNIAGVVVTPLLVGAMLEAHGGGGAPSAMRSIAEQLLLPFLAGQLLRPWVGGWVARHRRMLGLVDRGSILLMVYAVFSEAMLGGLWRQLPLPSLAALAVLDALLLALVLAITRLAARRLGFSREDEITIVFCGSKKSLITGIPMASVLFAGQAVSLIVLPLMLFHQLQLMVCADLARRYARPAPRSVPAPVRAPALSPAGSD